MASSRSTARRVLAAAAVSLLAVAGVALATPASAAVVTVTVSGTVTTADGSPAVGETIQFNSSFGPAFATTDEVGAFSTVTYYDSSNPSLMYQVHGAMAQVDTALLDGSPEITINIQLPSMISTTIEGTVTDAYGVPMAFAQLWAFTASGLVTATTDENGFYSMPVEVVAGGSLSIQVVGTSPFAYLSEFVDGGITHFDIVAGTGNVNTILLAGVVLAPDGTPVQGITGGVGTDRMYYPFTTDENGRFSVQIEYGEFGQISIWVPASQTNLEPADLLGLETVSVVVQQMPPNHVTFSGHVRDTDGNLLAHHPVAVHGGDFNDMWYAFTDDSGYYTIDAVLQAFDSYNIVTDGTEEPFWGPDPFDGASITVDLISRGEDYEIGVLRSDFTCDVNGDGTEDGIVGYQMLASGRTDWQIETRGENWGWRATSFGQGDIAEVYCADLNGDGASEIIARVDTPKNHPKKGTTTTTHTWWVYDYATDTVTESTFGKGDLDVYFENLDATPGVELIAVRTDTDAADKWWILDDPGSPIETFKLGFVADGTLAFEDINGAPGKEIVMSIVKPNGNTKVEYYTRATGVGSIVNYTIKTKKTK